MVRLPTPHADHRKAGEEKRAGKAGRAHVHDRDDRVPPEMRLFVKRVSRDDRMISDMEHEVSVFLAELEGKIAQLQNRFARAA